jgi:hypothetical protein
MREIPEDVQIEWSPFEGKMTLIAPGLAAPGRFVAHLDLGEEGTAAIEVEVVEGVPRCVELVLRRKGGISARETRVPLQGWVDQVVGAMTMEVSGADGNFEYGPASDRSAVASALAGKRPRGRAPVTDDVVASAAAAFNRRQSIRDVMAATGKSEATAYRYLRLARAAGLIEGED